MSKLLTALEQEEERGNLPEGATEVYKSTLEKFPEGRFVKPYNSEKSDDYSIFSHLEQFGLVVTLRVPVNSGLQKETYFAYWHDLDYKQYCI